MQLPNFSKGTLDRIDNDYFTLILYLADQEVFHETIHESEALKLAETHSNIIIL